MERLKTRSGELHVDTQKVNAPGNKKKTTLTTLPAVEKQIAQTENGLFPGTTGLDAKQLKQTCELRKVLSNTQEAVKTAATDAKKSKPRVKKITSSVFTSPKKQLKNSKSLRATGSRLRGILAKAPSTVESKSPTKRKKTLTEDQKKAFDVAAKAHLDKFDTFCSNTEDSSRVEVKKSKKKYAAPDEAASLIASYEAGKASHTMKETTSKSSGTIHFPSKARKSYKVQLSSQGMSSAAPPSTPPTPPPAPPAPPAAPPPGPIDPFWTMQKDTPEKYKDENDTSVMSNRFTPVDLAFFDANPYEKDLADVQKTDSASRKIDDEYFEDSDVPRVNHAIKRKAHGVVSYLMSGNQPVLPPMAPQGSNDSTGQPPGNSSGGNDPQNKPKKKGWKKLVMGLAVAGGLLTAAGGYINQKYFSNGKKNDESAKIAPSASVPSTSSIVSGTVSAPTASAQKVDYTSAQEKSPSPMKKQRAEKEENKAERHSAKPGKTSKSEPQKTKPTWRYKTQKPTASIPKPSKSQPEKTKEPTAAQPEKRLSKWAAIAKGKLKSLWEKGKKKAIGVVKKAPKHIKGASLIALTNRLEKNMKDSWNVPIVEVNPSGVEIITQKKKAYPAGTENLSLANVKDNTPKAKILAENVSRMESIAGDLEAYASETDPANTCEEKDMACNAKFAAKTFSKNNETRRKIAKKLDQHSAFMQAHHLELLAGVLSNNGKIAHSIARLDKMRNGKYTYAQGLSSGGQKMLSTTAIEGGSASGPLDLSQINENYQELQKEYHQLRKDEKSLVGNNSELLAAKTRNLLRRANVLQAIIGRHLSNSSRGGSINFQKDVGKRAQLAPLKKTEKGYSKDNPWSTEGIQVTNPSR